MMSPRTKGATETALGRQKGQVKVGLTHSFGLRSATDCDWSTSDRLSSAKLGLYAARRGDEARVDGGRAVETDQLARVVDAVDDGAANPVRSIDGYKPGGADGVDETVAQAGGIRERADNLTAVVQAQSLSESAAGNI